MSEAVRSAVSGSGVGLDTMAVLVCVPAAVLAATVYVAVIVTEAPGPDRADSAGEVRRDR